MTSIDRSGAVRLASPNDSAAIEAVLREAFAEFEPLYTPEAFAATVPSAEQITKRWREGPVWVAVRGDRVVGTIGAVLKPEGLYVRSMALTPETRGFGVGRALLEEVETWAMQHNAGRMFLSTTPFLHRAIRLYERFGFVRMGDGPHDLFGTPLFSMEKGLARRNKPQ